METAEEVKTRIIKAGHKAVDELIKVAEEPIFDNNSDDIDLSADKLKNAAMAKKLAIFDAFEILNKIESEKENLEVLKLGGSAIETKQGFAERRSK